MDDRVPLRRRHLQLGMRLLDKRPLFGAGNLCMRKEEPSARAPRLMNGLRLRMSLRRALISLLPLGLHRCPGECKCPPGPVWHSLDPHVMTSVHNAAIGGEVP
jgi:hypothetical protein